MNLAPIILFVYNRPWHTKQTLEALSANKYSASSLLYIFADGAKAGANTEALENIKKTREIIKSKKWCGEVIIIESIINKGLANSIIDGVTEIINKHGKVIVLEDDIVASKYFLEYMNDALNIYLNNEMVFSIGSFNFFATDDSVEETFFVPIPDCWGWATWSNRWKLFEPNAQKLLNRLREKGLINEFNLRGSFNFESMLIAQIQGKISSWAIRWQAVAYLENKLSLYPKYSVTKNIGFGNGGTHGGEDKFSNYIKFSKNKINVQHQSVATNDLNIEKMIKGYKNTTQPNKIQKVKLSFRKFIKELLPPILTKTYRKIRPHKVLNIWQGNFLSWDEAKIKCFGYENPTILEKTKSAILKVKNGEAAGERDSVLFDSIPHSWPLETLLLKIAIENDKVLNVIDFGGSLGSSYFQTKSIIPTNITLSWKIVEQHRYVDVGNSEIKDKNLSFYYSINDAITSTNEPILLLSSVLQYLEKPLEFLENIMTYKFKNILIDRTSFINESKNRLTIQHVPKTIYDASYPCWFFNEESFLAIFKENYSLIVDFDSTIDFPMDSDDNLKLYWKGFLFKLKTP